MKYTTDLGIEVDVKPISMGNRQLTRKVNKAFQLALKLDDDKIENFSDEFTELEDAFVDLCSEIIVECGLKVDDFAEADMGNFLTILRTGKLPAGGQEGKEPVKIGPAKRDSSGK